MKYMRFMSRKELDALLSGETLKNTTDWQEKNMKTQSVGFCFFDCLETPEECLRYLLGIAFPEVCVIFRKKGQELQKSRGRYAKPVEITSWEQMERTMNEQNMMHKREYCTQEYSRKTMVPIRVGKIRFYGSPRHKEFEIRWEEV